LIGPAASALLFSCYPVIEVAQAARSSQVSFLSILNSFVAGPLYRAFKKRCGLDCASGVAPVVAHVMADRQIFQVATSTFAQRFDVL
jgi:hypothetical protein